MSNFDWILFVKLSRTFMGFQPRTCYLKSLCFNHYIDFDCSQMTLIKLIVITISDSKLFNDNNNSKNDNNDNRMT